MSNETIIGLLSEASKRVGAVRKGEQNTHQRFMFRGIDAVVNAVSPEFDQLGIVVIPTVKSVTYADVQTGQKRTQQQACQVLVKYTFYAPDRSSVSATVIAEAMDSGDKASAKAMSVAFRIALLQTLCLPTDSPDPDHDSYERAPVRDEDDVRGLIAAATTLDELRAVWGDAKRHDLLGLLNLKRADMTPPAETGETTGGEAPEQGGATSEDTSK